MQDGARVETAREGTSARKIQVNVLYLGDTERATEKGETGCLQALDGDLKGKRTPTESSRITITSNVEKGGTRMSEGKERLEKAKEQGRDHVAG